MAATRVSSAPSPTREAAWEPDAGPLASRAPTPMTAIGRPATSRIRSERLGTVTSSRSAATGGTREARRAGRYAATTVTTSPSTMDTTTVRGFSSSPPPGMSRPMTLNSARSPRASSTPSSSPVTPPRVPTTAASPSTEPRTWRRVAPTARSRASSRVRCATSIEKVFKMMKVPTNRATRANTSRKMLMKRSPSLIDWALSSVTCWPVLTTVSAGGSTARIRAARVSWATPGLALTSIEVKWPGCSSSC